MNTVTARGLSRTACVIAMTYSAFAELKRAGLIEGGMFQISDDGESLCRELKDAGFEFNEGELESATAFIISGEGGAP